MNNPSPLIPQGSLLEQKNKGRTRVKVAVFVVLAVHGIGLLALLMQGCKKDNDTGSAATNSVEQAAATTNASPSFEPTNAPAVDTNLAAAGTNVVAPAVSAPESAQATDYKIQSGDTLSSVAHKFRVTVRALMDANPNVQPTKLQIGQTIHIPAPMMASTASNPAAAAADSGTGELVYTVKSGDTLSSIARDNHVTVRALETANSLKTTSIKVGQKLKIPVKPAAVTAGGTNTGAPASGQ